MTKRRKPWLASTLSFICPGVGQLYNGNLPWALAAIPVGLVITVASAFWLADSLAKLLIALALGFVFDVVFAVQAYREARRLGEVPLKKYQRWWVYGLFGVFLYGIPDGYGTLIPERFLSFQIPSESMVPNLLVGDRLVADGWAYWHREPVRGDVVVFKYPRDESVVYVKRLVGLPGDTVEVKDEEIYINGNRVAQRELGPGEKENGWAAIRYEETLGPKTHILQRIPLSPVPDYPPTKVPPESYFMMGDNRDRSSDSRVWGFVRRDQLLGRMNFVYFSWDSTLKRLRSDRFGLKIN